MKVFKFTLTDKELHMGVIRLDTPEVFKPLCVQSQGGHVCVWAEVDPVSALSERHFYVLMTGESIPRVHLLYIGTVQMGDLVLHIYMKVAS